MKSVRLAKSVALLTLIVSGSAIAKYVPATESSEMQITESLQFKLDADSPSSCQTPPTLDMLITRGEAVQGKKPTHHASLTPVSDSPYAQVIGIPLRKNYDKKATSWAYIDKVTTKDGKQTLILKGTSNLLKHTNEGTWTNNKDCSGTFVGTMVSASPKP